MFLDGKKPNTAKLVDMNFLADSVKYSKVIPLAKIQAKTAVFCKSYQMFILGYFACRIHFCTEN